MSSNASSAFAVNTYSYTLSHRVQDCLPALAQRGYSEFELMMYPGHLWPADTDGPARRQLRRTVESSGLRITTLNMPNIDLNIAGAASEMRAYSIANLRGVVELAGDLGAPGVVIGPEPLVNLLPLKRDEDGTRLELRHQLTGHLANRVVWNGQDHHVRQWQHRFDRRACDAQFLQTVPAGLADLDMRHLVGRIAQIRRDAVTHLATCTQHHHLLHHDLPLHC